MANFNTGLTKQQIMQALNNGLGAATTADLEAAMYSEVIARNAAINVEKTAREAADTVHDDILADLIDNGAKNKFRYPTRIGTNNSNAAQTYTQNGVKFTCNLDGTITIERVSTNQYSPQLWLYDDNAAITIDDYCDNKHVFSNGFAGSETTARVRLAKLNDGEHLTVDEYAVIPDKGTYTGINVSIIVYPQFTGTLTFKPMVCRKSAWDLTQKYVPYSPSLAELYALILSQS